ncbi:MAG: DsbA family protein, partial [bacterium]|nr:DsbA family protein [bacterium]
ELGTGTVEIPRENLSRYATELNLDMPAFETCMQSEQFKKEIEADQQAGDRFGIDGTPGFIVANYRVGGAKPFSFFATLIEKALEEKAQK